MVWRPHNTILRLRHSKRYLASHFGGSVLKGKLLKNTEFQNCLKTHPKVDNARHKFVNHHLGESWREKVVSIFSFSKVRLFGSNIGHFYAFKLERNSRKVREMELKTPSCPCVLFPRFFPFSLFSFSLFLFLSPPSLFFQKGFS